MAAASVQNQLSTSPIGSPRSCRAPNGDGSVTSGVPGTVGLESPPPSSGDENGESSPPLPPQPDKARRARSITTFLKDFLITFTPKRGRSQNDFAICRCRAGDHR